jgi:hypothetical protein
MDGCCQIGLEECGCEKRRNRAFDRTDWTSVVREAKANLRAVELQKMKGSIGQKSMLIFFRLQRVRIPGGYLQGC